MMMGQRPSSSEGSGLSASKKYWGFLAKSSEMENDRVLQLYSFKRSQDLPRSSSPDPPQLALRLLHSPLNVWSLELPGPGFSSAGLWVISRRPKYLTKSLKLMKNSPSSLRTSLSLSWMSVGILFQVLSLVMKKSHARVGNTNAMFLPYSSLHIPFHSLAVDHAPYLCLAAMADRGDCLMKPATVPTLASRSHHSFDFEGVVV